MKMSIMIALSLVISVQSFAIFIQVDLITKDHADLEYFTSLEIRDSLGKQLAFSENQGARLSANINDELRGKISIKVKALGYFPVILKYDCRSSNDSILVSNVLLVPAQRKKLPKNAICAEFPPKKRDIPRKTKVWINGEKRQLVADRKEVVRVAYVLR